MATSREAEVRGAGGAERTEKGADPGGEVFIKKAVQPVLFPSGVDKEKKPDGSLSAKQVKRAATEAMIAMRPQPSVNEMNFVYAKLDERDEHDLPRNKYKDIDAVIAAAVGFVAEGRKAA